MEAKEPLILKQTHHSLSNPIYIIKIGFVRLMENDAIILVGIWAVGWGVLRQFRLGEIKLLGLALAPWWLGFITLAAIFLISGIHYFKPGGFVVAILQSWVTPRRFAARTPAGDKEWRPMQGDTWLSKGRLWWK